MSHQLPDPLDDDVAPAAERGPAPVAAPGPPVLLGAGEDLLVVRDDLGPGCTTLVPAGQMVPANLVGRRLLSRATLAEVGVASTATYPDETMVSIVRTLAPGERPTDRGQVGEAKPKRRRT